MFSYTPNKVFIPNDVEPHTTLLLDALLTAGVCSNFPNGQINSSALINTAHLWAWLPHVVLHRINGAAGHMKP
jgi:hypothetical protein